MRLLLTDHLGLDSGCTMPILADQLGRPHGLTGRVVGRYLARRNAEFNRWVVEQLRTHFLGRVERFVELGSGPGIGLEEALRAFPSARLWGVDHSSTMVALSCKRNRTAVDSGRLTLLQGDPSSLANLAPVDIVLGVHILYFWHEPAAELSKIRAILRPGGLLALGYSLRQQMPRVVQRDFPREGHLLYDSDDGVKALLARGGFGPTKVLVKGDPESPDGRLIFASAGPS